MLKRSLFFSFLFLSLIALSHPITKNIQAKIDQLGLHGVDVQASLQNTKLLIAFCDTSDDNLILPNYYLENLLALQYQFVQKNNLEAYKLKLAYPLASIYHDQSKFEKELPILIYLYANLSKLNKLTQKYVLVKLELTKNRADLEASKASLLLSTVSARYQQDNLLFSFFLLFATIIIGILLYQNNVAKTKSNIKIELEVLRNDTLLKELHHRVKNNLQSMYSLLNMQKRRNVNESTHQILTSVQNRIQSMALVHQNLYTADNFEFVEVETYIHSLVNHLKIIYHVDETIINIEFDIHPELKLPIDQIISLGLIINEVVSNSFKYAFIAVQNGSLIISVKEWNKFFEVEVKDNGVGIIQEHINQDSLGMKLIKLMSEQIHADHTFTYHPGVTHCFKFKSMTALANAL